MTEGGSEFGLSQEIINNFGDDSIAGDSMSNNEDQEVPVKKVEERYRKNMPCHFKVRCFHFYKMFIRY